MINFKLFLSLGACWCLASHGLAEILVYGTKPKSWSGYFIEQNSKTKWPGPPNPEAEEGFYFWELDGIDRILEDDDRPQVIHQGQTFYPSSIYLNHRKKTKRITGSRVADDNPESFGRTYSHSGRGFPSKSTSLI